jgi:prepilin-type processing-associated H-X9-DG protein
MKSALNDRQNVAFTLIDLLVVIVSLVIIAALLLPALAAAKKKSSGLGCNNHLKNLYLGLKIWEGDNGDKYPMGATNNLGNVVECTNDGEMYQYFQVASNQLESPEFLICPADVRHWAANWSSLQNTNISYFLCLDATEAYPGMVIFGDRNVVGGTKLANGFTVFNPTNSIHWGSDMHNGSGNIGLTDGSVMQTTSNGLSQALIQATNGVTSGTVRYAFP